MSNKKKNNNVKNQENIEVEEKQNIGTESTVENVKNVNNEEKNIPEHSDQIRNLVGKMNQFVQEFERGWSIKRLEPIKKEINDILNENKEKEYLSKSDRNFLFFINRVIYGKVEQPAWRRQNEPERESNRPETAPKQLEFKSLNDKVDTLKRAISGYGNKSIITSIEDIKEERFYCLKETEIDGKMQLECSLKFTKIDGKAVVEAMTPEEAYAIRDSYLEIKDNPEEVNNISYYVREINNNPTHADRYFLKIATSKEKEAEYVNTDTLEQEIEE